MRNTISLKYVSDGKQICVDIHLKHFFETYSASYIGKNTDPPSTRIFNNPKQFATLLQNLKHLKSV